MTSHRDYSAGSLLVVVVLASILPFLLVGSFLLTAYVKSERDVALERVTTLAAALSAAVDRKLASYVGNLETLAGALHVDASDLPRFMAVARAGSQSLKGSIVLLDRSGQQHINTAAVADIALPMTADPKAVQRVFETGRPHISDLVSGTVHQRFIFSVRVPLTVNEEIRYALGYVPPTDEMLSLLQEVALPRGWFAAVLDRRGRIVARSFRHEDFYGRLASEEFLSQLSASAGVLDSVDLEGRETVTAYMRSDYSEWQSVVWVPKDLLEAKADTALGVLISLTGVTLFVSLLVGYLVSHLIRSPTRRLVHAAHALGAGKEVQFARSLMREANVVGSALSDASNDIRLYMREISHRSKNLLAVVQALARQTQRGSKDLSEFGQRFADRLQSLAQSHDLLIERNWSGTFVHDLVKAQLRSFADENDPRLELTGGPILLSPTAAQHIGLALHELATNATKYGAWSAPTGRVHVSWSKGIQADGSEHFQLSWIERGGPAVSKPMRAGFGTLVIEQAVAKGISGTACLHWNSEGIEWTLDAPASCLATQSTFDIGANDDRA